jgi:hypothetical protein
MAYLSRCIDSLTPAFFAIARTRLVTPLRVNGPPVLCERKGNMRRPLRGNFSKASRSTRCSGTH